MDTLTQMPARFDAGTTLTYTRTLPDTPANDGWALVVYLNGKSAANATAVASGADFVVTFTAAATAPLLSGLYQFTERATKAGVVKDSPIGTVFIGPNLATAAAGALQSRDEKMLEMIDAAIEGRMVAGIDEYQIGTRLVKKIPIAELMKMRDVVARRVEAAKNPGKAGRTILINFPSPGFDR